MSKDNNKKTPKVRFPGFDEDWEQRKLIEVCDYVDYRGKTPTKTENGIFLVTAKNVKDGFIDYETSKEYISENAYEEVMRRGKPEIGDVLITTEAPCGNVAQVNKADIALAQRIIKYRGHIGVVDNTYLKYYLLSPEFQKILNAKSSGGTVQGIKGSILHQQKIIYPSYEEQKKIGQHMDNLDHLITLHQRKLEKLKEYKKGMLQKMFPKNGETVPEVRFPWFDGEWEERKVSELCSISTGKSNTQDKVEDGKYPFYVRSPIIERSTKYLYDEEAVITVGDGVGTGKVFHYVNGKYDLHQRCYRMYGFSDELNAHYFYHTFSKLFYKRVMAMTAKTSVDSVRLEMISDMKIPVPDIEEQRKIGSFLDNIDRLITLQQKKIEFLKEFKKGCLQQMFV